MSHVYLIAAYSTVPIPAGHIRRQEMNNGRLYRIVPTVFNRWQQELPDLQVTALDLFT
jgi:hypothetical protein